VRRRSLSGPPGQKRLEKGREKPQQSRKNRSPLCGIRDARRCQQEKNRAPENFNTLLSTQVNCSAFP
jgi:hypothetical protein